MRRLKSTLKRLNPLAAKSPETPKKASPFGGFRKKTMTATEFFGSSIGLVLNAPTLYKVWIRHDIDAGFREELMLAVAKLNDCIYCSWGHHEWAHIAGVPEEELAHIEQMDPKDFDRRKWIAISYVRALVTANFGKVPRELSKEMRAHYSELEIHEINLIARVMDISNRGANTYDSMRARLRGEPAANSRLIDEAVLSAAFLSIAPVVVLFLSRASKRPFMEMARSLIDYTRQVEQHRNQAAG